MLMAVVPGLHVALRDRLASGIVVILVNVVV